MIGDYLSDIEAGIRADPFTQPDPAIGMATVFVLGDSATQKPGGEHAAALATAIAASLPDYVERYLHLRAFAA